MSLVTVVSGSRQTQIEQVAPVAQTSTNTLTVLAGSEMDMRGWQSLGYTLKVATNSIDWTVFGANTSDYSDEVVVQSAATVAAAAVGSYVVAQAPFGYYRVKIKSTVNDVHGAATLVGTGKAA